jgi:hypothetical protein
MRGDATRLFCFVSPACSINQRSHPISLTNSLFDLYFGVVDAHLMIELRLCTTESNGDRRTNAVWISVPGAADKCL